MDEVSDGEAEELDTEPTGEGMVETADKGIPSL